MSFEFITEYWPLYLQGAGVTLLLAFFTVLLGFAFGILIAFAKLSKRKILSLLATTYIEIIRGTPLLVQMLIIFYMLPAFGVQIPNLFGIAKFGDYSLVVLALVINSSAYIAEIIRGGIQAVDKGQTEAALALGMPKSLMMRKIILPQAIKNILPALGNEFIVIIKESAIVSVVGIMDLMFAAQQVRSATYLAFEPLIMAAVMYFIMTFSLSKVMQYVEGRLAKDATH
ncbi:MAG: amino acid ABC transporter permease [Culicoidibacterales bacterium]